MRGSWSEAPRWVLSLLVGLPFGAFTALYGYLDGEDHSLLRAPISGTVGGVFFGVG